MNQGPRAPLLIYDGTCQFCIYWVRYWQKLTGDRVDYKPFQDVAAQYPEISTEEFTRAVQYIAPDGERASAAKASFLTLSHAQGKSFWLSLYKKLPGFAFLSEKMYALISTHRSFFYYVTLLLWGRDYEPPRYALISWFFLRLFGLIYLSAFISFGTQALGLIGSHGILPLSALINAAQQFGIERYWFLPMVFWLNSSDFAIQAVCWGGAGLSLMLVFNILPRVSLFLLYLFYLSLLYAGQAFMTFQWDIYLLETGVLAFFLIRPSILGIWLMRWLLFRFIFEAGLVKIFSGDASWQNFSSLYYYFFTQPLPTPLAWYAHNLPQSLLTVGTMAALFIELVIPFFIFFPRNIRFIAAFSILLMQTTILLTGNYNFFNLLTILLCLLLFDDAALQKIIPKSVCHFIKQRVGNITPTKTVSFIAVTFAVITVSISLLQFCILFGGTLPMPILRLYSIVAPFQIVNTYGPFAVITTERMEIIIEGSDNNIDWLEYKFKYKPGDINRRPLWNIPHQPRLDWQMWFAALSTPEQNPWLVQFIQRLLENTPEVIALLEYNPFPNHPPTYLHAQFYEYQFTTPEERDKTGAWWSRRLVRLYYP